MMKTNISKKPFEDYLSFIEHELGCKLLDWQKAILQNEYAGKHYCYHFGRISGKYVLYRAAQILEEEMARDNGCLPARLYELDGYASETVAYEDVEWINLETTEWKKEN